MAKEKLITKKNILILSVMVLSLSIISFVSIWFIHKKLIQDQKYSLKNENRSISMFTFESMIIPVIKKKSNDLLGHLQITIHLAVQQKETKEILDKHEIRFKNFINTFLFTKSYLELNNPDPDQYVKNIRSLKDDLLKEINRVLLKDQILEVYFSEYLFQPLS